MISDERIAAAAAAYLDAALNKIDVAEYHEERLAGRLASGEATRREVQAYFEGLLYAGVAASDQVAEVLNQAFELGLDRPNLRLSLDALARCDPPPETVARRFFDDLNRWRRRPRVREAGRVRWRATHHYYAKGVHQGAWQYEASDSLAFEDGGSVGELAAAFAGELSDLHELVERLAELLGVGERLRGLRQR